MAGQFLTTAQFGSNTVTSAGAYDTFVAKLTDAGSSAKFVWAERAGGHTADVVNSLAVSGASVYVAGTFRSPRADFGSSTLTNAGESDVFVAKLVDAGQTASFTWAQGAGGSGTDRASGVAVNGSSVYLTGIFGANGATASFGGINLTSAGRSDVFVAKLTDTGSNAGFIWVEQAGGLQDEMVSAIAVQGANVYVAGGFSSSIVRLGGTTLVNKNTNLTSDVFAAKLTDTGRAGSFVWAQQAGGTGDDAASGLVLSGTSVYVAGYAVAPATFGSQTVSMPNSSGMGFLASLTDMALPTKKPTLLAGVNLYPNPAHKRTTVQLPATSGATQATLTLSDAVGRIVSTHSLRLAATNTTAELSVEDLAPGLYRVQVQTGSQSVIRSLAVD
jgi:hypothetical protein